MNILFHSGQRVLYSVFVCNLAFTSCKTQNGSLLPVKSAAATDSALYTIRQWTRGESNELLVNGRILNKLRCLISTFDCEESNIIGVFECVNYTLQMRERLQLVQC